MHLFLKKDDSIKNENCVIIYLPLSCSILFKLIFFCLLSVIYQLKIQLQFKKERQLSCVSRYTFFQSFFKSNYE